MYPALISRMMLVLYTAWHVTALEAASPGRPIEVAVVRSNEQRLSQPFYNRTETTGICDSLYKLVLTRPGQQTQEYEDDYAFDVCIFDTIHPYFRHPLDFSLNLNGKDAFSSRILRRMYDHLDIKPTLTHTTSTGSNLEGVDVTSENILKLGYVALASDRFGVALAVVTDTLEELVFIDIDKVYTVQQMKPYDLDEHASEEQESKFKMVEVERLSDVHEIRVISPKLTKPADTASGNGSQHIRLDLYPGFDMNVLKREKLTSVKVLLNRQILIQQHASLNYRETEYIQGSIDDVHDNRVETTIDDGGDTHNDEDRDSHEYLSNQAEEGMNAKDGLDENIVCYYDEATGQLSSVFEHNQETYTLLPLVDDYEYQDLSSETKAKMGMPPHVLLVTKNVDPTSINSAAGDNVEGLEQLATASVSQRLRNRKVARSGQMTGPYIIEAIFYVTYDYLTLPAKYLPHLAATVDELFKDPTVEIPIRFRLISIESYPSNLISKGNMSATHIQLKQYKNDHHPDVDVAILISNLTVDADYVGRATTNGICDGEGDSVAVCRDTGFSTARTIVHEIGHLLGAEHDMDHDEGVCASEEARGIMHYSSAPITHKIMSECTVKSIQKTLRSGKGNCLLTQMTEANLNNYKYPARQINEWICQTHFGPEYSIYYGKRSNCREFLCSSGSTIRWGSETIPFDKTPCLDATNSFLSEIETAMHCIRGQCVPDPEKIPYSYSRRLLGVDDLDYLSETSDNQEGGDESRNNSGPRASFWAAWGPWSECNGFCNLGYQSRTRKCHRNSNGDMCLGENRELKHCRINMPTRKECEDDRHRYYKMNDKICKMYDNGSRFYPNHVYNTYIRSSENMSMCGLYCKKGGNYIRTTHMVVDGTHYGSNKMCMDGHLF